jgi:hypothetical protein
MITITTYKELQEYVNAFRQRQLNLLVIVSRGGLGKTFIAEETLMEEGPLIFSGHVTPMGLYKDLCDRNEEENKFICVFDDVDALLLNKTNVALLKQVCDTREEKTVKYCTTSPNLDEYPSEFTTSCKVLMLMNSIKTEDKNLNALLTRAHLIKFEPTNYEVIKHIEEFGGDEDILNFLKTYAPFSKVMNLRVYKRAEELKLSKLDWKKEIINVLDIDPSYVEVETLLKKYKTDKEREKKFSKSRPTYYRYKKLFLEKNPEYIKC